MLPTLQGAPKDGFGEAEMVWDMPEPWKFPSLEILNISSFKKKKSFFFFFFWGGQQHCRIRNIKTVAVPTVWKDGNTVWAKTSKLWDFPEFAADSGMVFRGTVDMK